MTLLKSKIAWIGLTAVTVVAVGTASAQQRRGGYSYQSGHEIYEHVCQSCHMADAKGAVGAGMYPALAGNRKLTGTAYPILVMLRGQKAMPSFSDLTDAQIAETANYIRTNFGNQFQGVATPRTGAKAAPATDPARGATPGLSDARQIGEIWRARQEPTCGRPSPELHAWATRLRAKPAQLLSHSG